MEFWCCQRGQLGICLSCGRAGDRPNVAAIVCWGPSILLVLPKSHMVCRLKKMDLLEPEKRACGLLKPRTCITYGKVTAEAKGD